MSTPSEDPAEGGFRILFVADVVGKPGRRVVSRLVPELRSELNVDFCVLNGENAADGAGMTRSIVDRFLESGVDVITSGNHVWGRREILSFIDDEPRLIRPANYSDATPGRGATVVESAAGTPVLVMNAVGRVFMNPADCPFRAVEKILDDHPEPVLRLLDFHAEATSEKNGMGWHLDGRVTAVVGTHTHVATADERVLPRGTAYITDAGMTGPHQSILGVRRDAALRRMVTGLPTRFDTATGDVRLSGVLITADPSTGRAVAIERLQRCLEE